MLINILKLIKISTIKQISISLLGVFWIAFITYRLLILKRIPYEINNKISLITLAIILTIVISNIIEFITLYNLLHKNENINPFSKYLVHIVNIVYWKPLLKIEEYVLKFKLVKIILNKVGKILLKKVTTLIEIKIILVMFYIMPRLVVGICLMIDVYNKHISLMYEAIILYMITILFNSNIHMLNTLSKKDKESLETEYITTLNINNQLYIKSLHSNITYESYISKKSEWEYLYNLIDLLEAIKICKETSIILKLRLFTISLFLLSWVTYILISTNKLLLHMLYHYNLLSYIILLAICLVFYKLHTRNNSLTSYKI